MSEARKLGNEIRVFEESHVEDEVGIEQYAVFIAKADDIDVHTRALVAVMRTKPVS